jgi:hypothetical protein
VQEETTFFDFINFNALEKAVEKDIAEKVASKLELEDWPGGTMSRYKPETCGCEETKTTVSAAVCFATLQEVAGKHIVTATDFEDIQ